MAIIIQGLTNCSICDKTLQPEDDVVSTTHFIVDDKHHLWRYSDSGMHRSCFLKWQHKDEFKELYNQLRNEMETNLKLTHEMDDFGNVLVERAD